MNNGKVKQILLNILLILLAFTVQNCVFPLLPFLAATPNLLLILTFSFGFIHGRNAGMFYGILSGLLLDLFYSGPFGFYTLIYVYIGYFNGIFTRYYYTASDLKRCKRSLVQSVYLYISIPDPRASKSALLFYQDHAAGDHIYSCDHPVSIPSVPFSQQTAGRYWKKERYHHCLMNCWK